jgi:DNA-binding LacI/PurR family transcriptional regulator
MLMEPVPCSLLETVPRSDVLCRIAHVVGKEQDVATIYDVAREAGVGVGTVSRVLSDSPHVAPGTRLRVEEAVARLGFRPTPAARALRRKRTDIIEIVVPLVTRHFYVEALRGIETALTNTNFTLVIRTIERESERERVFDRVGARGAADGVLIVSLLPTPELARRLQADGVCVVLIDAEATGVASVAADHEMAGRRAVQHLLDLGHRQIALIDSPDDLFSATSRPGRNAGFRAPLAAAGIPLPAAFTQVAEFSPEGGAAALTALLRLEQRPTAVFVSSDTQALGALEAARARECRVPEDLSVVGYNDIEVAQYAGLTTLHTPMREMGRRGAALLLDLLAQPEAPPQTQRIDSALVVRRTTGPAPASIPAAAGT